MSENKRDRDRATAAFRRWARHGCPDAGQIDKENPKGAEDLRACAAVFESLRDETAPGRKNAAGADILRAVRIVYMEEPRRPLRRNEITMRVRRQAWDSHVTERTVYIWLAAARRMWAEFRFRSGGNDGK